MQVYKIRQPLKIPKYSQIVLLFYQLNKANLYYKFYQKPKHLTIKQWQIISIHSL